MNYFTSSKIEKYITNSFTNKTFFLFTPAYFFRNQFKILENICYDTNDKSPHEPFLSSNTEWRRGICSLGYPLTYILPVIVLFLGNVREAV